MRAFSLPFGATITVPGPQNAIPFGHWLLLKRLAVGGMAEIFLAKDTQADRLVVLKRILPHLAEEVPFVQMFLDEARIAASLHHPNVVEVYELGRLEGSTFIAMEWVDGIDLRKVLAKEQARGGVVPPGVAAWLVARLCEGLHYAHVRTDPDDRPLGIIHRDISPQNVMVTFGGEVKLVDFGIAKATAWVSRSKPGVIKGKFLYLSPEQLAQEELDHRADLFALGTLLYELTTGKSPFYRSTTEAVIYAIRREDAAPPHTVRAGYPPLLSKAVMKCLQRDRAHRFQSAEAVGQALEDFMRVEAPTTRRDVVKYVAGLFGSEEERTHVYVPPSEPRSEAPVGDPRRELSLVDEVPTQGVARRSRRAPGFQSLEEERTTLMAPKPAPVSLPEGRRPTGEPEVTEPIPAAPRDTATTAVLGAPPVLRATAYSAAGAGEVDETAVSLSGSHNLKVGEVLPELLPTRGHRRLADAEPPRSAAARPGPPVPSSEIPEVADHQRGAPSESMAEDTEPPQWDSPPGPISPPAERQRPPVLSRPPELRGGASRPRASELPETRVADAETAESKRPSPAERGPRSAPRPPGRSRPPPVGDPDDLVDTVDQASLAAYEEAPPTGGTQRVILLSIVAAGALIAILLLAWVLWPASASRPRGKSPAPPPARGPVAVKIQLNAPKGTTLSIDGVAIAPGEVRQVTPGKLSVDYRCPPKKKQRATDERLTIEVVAADEVQAIDLPCR